MGPNFHDCSSVFQAFEFEELQTATPPDKKGIYVLRVVKRGLEVTDIISQLDQVLHQMAWPLVSKKVNSRISRLRNIGDCPYIYIGAAGPRPKSSHTLDGRYKDFAGRHTAMFPVWALVYFGWQLDYGYLVGLRSGQLEEDIKAKYKKMHEGRLPALVSR